MAFGDNNTFLWNTFQEGLPIYSVDTIKEKYIDAVIVIASKKYVSDIYSQLLVQGLNRKNIFYPRYKQLIGSTGNQYFDLPYFFVDKGNEVFVDAGCFDGMTSVAFAEWCSYSYSEIYAFEPDKLCGGRCIKTFKDYNIRDAHFINKGTYDSNKVLSFASNGTASGKVGNSIESIEVTSIDEVLAGKPATFIKMDVEGSEMASLIGAQQTIRKYRPKLAICVYHKPQDIIDIPAYILELVPDYKLYLRHYLTCPWETVLYAV